MAIDTACSSALVGAHLGAAHAAKTLAPTLAGGVNLMLAERTTAVAQVSSVSTHTPSISPTSGARARGKAMMMLAASVHQALQAVSIMCCLET